MRVIINYGGGSNSTALIVRAVREGLPISAVLFADTGGEWPETYTYVEGFRKWLEAHHVPLHVVRGHVGGSFVSLEDDCVGKGRAPSIAYGFKSCSERWKTRPCWAWVKNKAKEDKSWRGGLWVRGIDADESHRAKQGGLWADWKASFPLIEWKMGRQECIDELVSSGLPLPGKSACFFCPSAPPREVAVLRSRHPDLFRRGLDMEARARDTFGGSIKGLGRSFSWEAVDRSERLQVALPFARDVEQPCGCYSGARDADIPLAPDYCGSWDIRFPTPVRKDWSTSTRGAKR